MSVGAIDVEVIDEVFGGVAVVRGFVEINGLEFAKFGDAHARNVAASVAVAREVSG